MGLSEALLRAAARRPHLLVVTMPGGIAVRLAVEAESRRRGWPAAASPADADVLVVAGQPAPASADVLEAVWRAMPAPRSRMQTAEPTEVAARLDAAQAELADRTAQQALAGLPAAIGTAGGPEPDHDMGGVDKGGTDKGGADMGGMDMGGMEMPAGLPMADRGEDRDGLTLDRLHLSMGPLLPDWPTGLIIDLTLQGDVIQHAAVVTPRAAGSVGSFWSEPWRRDAAGEPVTVGQAARRRMSAHLDSLGRFLAVAGWDQTASSARRLRDDALDLALASRLVPDVHRLTRRIARSRTLQWLTGGLGGLTFDDAVATGVADASVAARATGDVTVRYRRWCTDLVDVAAMLDDGSPLAAGNLEPPRGRLDGAAPSAGVLALLPRLLGGTDLAAARLIVASLDPDLDEVTVQAPVRRGQ